jgi:TonB family protein
MKRNIKIVLSILMLFGMGCSILNTGDTTYTPPYQKNHPRLLYPKTAQENEFTGNSKVLMVISKTGTVNKAEIVGSSGFALLDSAAVEYCENLLFYPATRNGQAVTSRMEMDVKFNIATPFWDANNYVKDVRNLYSSYIYAFHKSEIQKEILDKHNEFIQKMNDALNFNFYVEQVISSELSSQWRADWNSWPLSFLLYQDFIVRFPDYADLAGVKAILRNSVKDDIQYIENTPAYDSASQRDKEKILTKIKKFMSEQYPDFIMKENNLNSNLGKSGERL